MPIGKVWIYRLLFVILFVCLFVCFFDYTVTDLSGEDKAIGVKFCTAVHQHPGQGISHFGELCSPRSRKSDESVCGEWTQDRHVWITVGPLHWWYLLNLML